MDDPGKVMIALGFFASFAYSIRTVANAVLQMRRKPDGRADGELSGAADARLARLEHAVDAIAVEVERISEGQRFTTRLLSERARPVEAAALPSSMESSEQNGRRAN